MCALFSCRNVVKTTECNKIFDFQMFLFYIIQKWESDNHLNCTIIQNDSLNIHCTTVHFILDIKTKLQLLIIDTYCVSSSVAFCPKAHCDLSPLPNSPLKSFTLSNPMKQRENFMSGKSRFCSKRIPNTPVQNGTLFRGSLMRYMVCWKIKSCK